MRIVLPSRVKIPTADCESENNVTSLNLLFLASTLTWSNAILIATSSPNKIEALLATGWCKSILSWLGKNRHAPAPGKPILVIVLESQYLLLDNRVKHCLRQKLEPGLFAEVPSFRGKKNS